MTVPNANRAIIAADKLTAYLLNMSHKRGAAKARWLLGLGIGPTLLTCSSRTCALSTSRSRSHARMRARAVSYMRLKDR